tara:strand:+ start:104 stop:688 length:585 start_codon:yes stop_codon:yes gene_type:complete
MIIVPAYLPPVSFFKKIINLKTLYFSISTNYQKQTYRNRCIICTPNGIQNLIIPIKHNQNNKSYNKTEIYNQLNWQKNHWKAIKSAYNSSPFFEYYLDDFDLFYKKEYKLLYNFNYDIFLQILKCIELNINVRKTNKIVNYIDLKKILDPKKDRENYNNYSQVFIRKNGFHSDLSIIDLIFNLGPRTNEYLNSI